MVKELFIFVLLTSLVSTEPHYPIEGTRNCPRTSTLFKLFQLPKATKHTAKDTTCCTFQDLISTSKPKSSSVQLNDFAVFFGQAIWSHDLSRSATDSTTQLSLNCRDGRKIEMTALKLKVGNVENQVTACMDGSIVYGSEKSTLTKLTGNSFPRLRFDAKKRGTCRASVCKVPMDNPLRKNLNELFAFGEGRGNENPGLQSVHILWARRHNQWVDYYQRKKPSLSQKQLFTRARARIIAEIQRSAVLYIEALIGQRITYRKKYEKTGAQVRQFAEFHHAINRFQHSQLRSEMELRTVDGKITQRQSLFNSFFNTKWIDERGPAAVYRGILENKCSNVGLQMTDQITASMTQPRSLNLAALDCGRGRELGFATYNAIYQQLFRRKIKKFADISTDKRTLKILKSIYGKDASRIDLFIGGLAEPLLHNAAVGKTFRAIFLQQLHQVMYHDENWYQRSKSSTPLSRAERLQVERLSIAELLLQSGGLQCVPKDAFRVPSRQNPMLCKKDILDPFGK